ncbi:hypothetical protein, partial [Agromyces seonyuensis]
MDAAARRLGDLEAAMARAVEGDLDGALRRLQDPRSAADPDLRSPLARAEVGVLEVLVLTWSGDFAAAQRRLLAAAADGPLALPLAGLGVAL